MVVENQTIVIYAGNYRLLRFPVLDEDAGGDPLPAKNLTGFEATFALAFFGESEPLREDPLLDFSTTSGEVVITSPETAGIIEVELEGEHTVDITPGDYYFELEVWDATGRTNVVATGTLTIKTNVDNVEP